MPGFSTYTKASITTQWCFIGAHNLPSVNTVRSHGSTILHPFIQLSLKKTQPPPLPTQSSNIENRLKTQKFHNFPGNIPKFGSGHDQRVANKGAWLGAYQNIPFGRGWPSVNRSRRVSQNRLGSANSMCNLHRGNDAITPLRFFSFCVADLKRGSIWSIEFYGKVSICENASDILICRIRIRIFFRLTLRLFLT